MQSWGHVLSCEMEMRSLVNTGWNVQQGERGRGQELTPRHRSVPLTQISAVRCARPPLCSCSRAGGALRSLRPAGRVPSEFGCRQIIFWEEDIFASPPLCSPGVAEDKKHLRALISDIS